MERPDPLVPWDLSGPQVPQAPRAGQLLRLFPDNTFPRITGTEVSLLPDFSGTINIGDIANATLSGLSIPVAAGTRFLMVFSTTASGILLVIPAAGAALPKTLYSQGLNPNDSPPISIVGGLSNESLSKLGGNRLKTLSLCMIVKNEETQLENCLSSVCDIVDEIIVTDTGSTDATKEIAHRFTDHVFDFAWVDDFSKARNFSFSQASMDYILWLDADDILLEGDRRRLKALKETLDSSVDAVMMKYDTAFDSAGNATFSYYRERVVKRERCFVWKEPVHEYLEVYGEIIYSDVRVTHHKVKRSSPGRNLAIYEKILASGGSLSARGTYYYARELKEGGKTEEAIRFFNRFLDEGKGWFEDNIAACGELAACYGVQGDRTAQFRALTRSFIYDTPRAENCCALGYAWKETGDFKRASFWFHLAATLEKPKESWGFIQEDCWGYIPCIELAVCYDRMGLPKVAEQYNERAANFKPDDPAVKFNQNYFRLRREQESQNSEM